MQARPPRILPSPRVLLAGALFVLGACTAPTTAASGPEIDATSRTTTPTTTAPSTTVPTVELETSTSFGQVTVQSVDPGAQVVALDPDTGSELGRATALTDGAAIVRNLPPGPVALELWSNGRPVAAGGVIDLPDDTPPPQSVYRGQRLEPGFNYLTVRDGTTLSAFVTLPGPVTEGPYPTLVEYSGYSPSDPRADDPTRALVPLLDYALVQVNVRGTGCSGGSFDAFEPLQGLDGYDVIETVAVQDWSANVGMFGISYPGIMQLGVAATRPPSLAAIAPLSVIDSVQSVLYPGGIYNNGFGQAWTRQVSQQAGASGQAWTVDRIAAGDQRCEDNQRWRDHNPDLVSLTRQTPFRNALTDERSPDVERIDVPVYLAGAWQDEQTGGRFPSLIPRFENAPVVRATLYNGLHVDPLGPTVLGGLIEFYDLFVAERVPDLDVVTRFLAGAGLSTVFDAPLGSLSLPPNRFVGSSLDEARQVYEREPGVRILFEQGATEPGLPVTHFDASFDQWPPSELQPVRWYLDATTSNGALTESPAAPTTVAYTTDPDEGARVIVRDLDRIWTATPGWDWQRSNGALTFTTEPFATDVVMVGPASADLRVAVDGTDGDIEVTLSSIGPEGSETYIQNGWLRLSQRQLDDDATDLRPTPSHLSDDVALLEPGVFVPARVEILPFAQVFRAGTRLRLTIDTPGNSRPQWTFDILDEPVRITVATGGADGSSLLMPVVPGIEPPDDGPACGALRGQPCRG